MDYLEIVLQGYFNENNKEFLEKYFLREFKKAEKEQFFEADEFFSGCTKVIDGWEKYLQDEVNKRKTELYLMLSGAKTGTMTYGDLQGKTIQEKRQETIEYCEKELNDVRPDGIGDITFYVNLFQLTNGRIRERLTYKELGFIKESISNAFEKVKPQNDTTPPQPIDKDQNRTKKVIAEYFESMDKKGWEYAFRNDHDYNLFADVLTNFFQYKPYTLPKATIKLKRTCKTKLAKALGDIHAELSETPLKSDLQYLKIAKVLNHFEDVSDFELVKAMQR